MYLLENSYVVILNQYVNRNLNFLVPQNTYAKCQTNKLKSYNIYARHVMLEIHRTRRRHLKKKIICIPAYS